MLCFRLQNQTGDFDFRQQLVFTFIKQLKKTTNGDLLVTIIVEVPKSLSRAQKEELKKLQTTFESKQFPMQKEYKDKL